MRRAAKVDGTAIVKIRHCQTASEAANLLGISKATLSRWLAEDGKVWSDIKVTTPPVVSGQRFGRWSVVRWTGTTRYIPVRCDCGSNGHASLYHLKSGESKSCGCLKRERTTQESTKHGRCGTPEYNSWMAMKARCHNPNASNYCYYGGRGVSVCPEWRDNFEQFFADMGPRPSLKHSVDRIDPNGDYAPMNCRWATHQEQMQNQRRHHAQG